MDSSTSKKSEEQVSEMSDQPETTCPSLNQQNNTANVAHDVEQVSEIEICDNPPAELVRPSDEEGQGSDIEGEEANVLEKVEKEVEEITEDEEEDYEVRQVLELLEKEESDGEFIAQFEAAGHDSEDNESEEEIVLYFGK